MGYGRWMKRQRDRFGAPCWLLLYQADMRARRGQLAHHRRWAAERLLQEPSWLGFDPDYPREYAFKAITNDKTWWDEQLKEL